MRILIIYPNLGPSHIMRLRALENIFPKIVTIEIANCQKIYLWEKTSEPLGFECVTLFRRPYDSLSDREKREKLKSFLNSITPSAIFVTGYFNSEMRMAALWGKKLGLPTIMMTDTWAGDRRRYWIKEKAKSILVRRLYDAAFIAGQRSFEYMLSLGFKENQVWRGVGVVDNDHFSSRAHRTRDNAESIRTALGLPNQYFLTVTRLSEEKNIHTLIKAFLLYQSCGGHWDLVIVGSGPQEVSLRSMANAECGNTVHFLGWKQYNELPAYYRLASCFVLPSKSEAWGLVVNEAMACGLPVLVSRRCGCLPELCWRGINGFDFDFKDVGALARLMLYMSRGKADLKAMGEASQRIVAQFTPKTWAMAAKDCVETVIEMKQKHRS